MIVSVILAAGFSTRFHDTEPKQLFKIDGKSILKHSVDTLSEFSDKIIVVTNSKCVENISGDFTILLNDEDSRLASIKIAIDYLDSLPIQPTKILLHDAARPFVNRESVKKIIQSSKDYKFSQFYFPLVNGLLRNNLNSWEVAPREDFIELVTPQCVCFELFKTIFRSHIETGIDCEILPVISRRGIEYNLIEGSRKYLRKITTKDDL